MRYMLHITRIGLLLLARLHIVIIFVMINVVTYSVSNFKNFRKEKQPVNTNHLQV